MFAALLFVWVNDWCGFVSPEVNAFRTEQACVVEVKRLAEDVLKNAPSAKVMLTCLKVRGEVI